jgi:hypothetical protein
MIWVLGAISIPGSGCRIYKLKHDRAMNNNLSFKDMLRYLRIFKEAEAEYLLITRKIWLKNPAMAGADSP